MTESMVATIQMAVERERAKLSPVQRIVADEISRVAGHVLTYGTLPTDLAPELRTQLDRGMAREGLSPQP